MCASLVTAPLGDISPLCTDILRCTVYALTVPCSKGRPHYCLPTLLIAACMVFGPLVIAAPLDSADRCCSSQAEVDTWCRAVTQQDCTTVHIHELKGCQPFEGIVAVVLSCQMWVGRPTLSCSRPAGSMASRQPPGCGTVGFICLSSVSLCAQ